MNRIDRLFSILLVLQNQRRVRAQDLAERFGISVRTVYRDVAALAESGVPIVSLPGEGYELMEGFYLPPLVLTDGEATALSLGARLLMQQATGALVGDAERALAKILVALPGRTRERAEALRGIIGFIAPPERFNLDDPQLLALQRAIHNRQTVRLRYHGYQRDQVTERVVEPGRLYYAEGIWYLEAYCRLRQGRRSFRLSRVEQLEVQPQTFQPRPAQPAAEAQSLVKIRFTARAARWVRERQYYAFESEQALPGEEGVIMTYCVSQPSEMVPWVLSWGAAAEVLAPADLRQRLRQEAAQLVEMLT